jgi:hypothetical protein
VLTPLAATLQTVQDDDTLHTRYRDWVLSDPKKASERLHVQPWRFEIRREVAEATLISQHDSDGYRSLDEHQRRWFDHATTRPEHMADLTKSTPHVAISIASDDGARAFAMVLKKREAELAGHTLDALMGDLTPDERTVARARRAEVTTDLHMDPSDDAANRRVVRERLAILVPTLSGPAVNP